MSSETVEGPVVMSPSSPPAPAVMASLEHNNNNNKSMAAAAAAAAVTENGRTAITELQVQQQHDTTTPSSGWIENNDPSRGSASVQSQNTMRLNGEQQQQFPSSTGRSMMTNKKEVTDDDDNRNGPSTTMGCEHEVHDSMSIAKHPTVTTDAAAQSDDENEEETSIPLPASSVVEDDGVVSSSSTSPVTNTTGRVVVTAAATSSSNSNNAGTIPSSESPMTPLMKKPANRATTPPTGMSNNGGASIIRNSASPQPAGSVPIGGKATTTLAESGGVAYTGGGKPADPAIEAVATTATTSTAGTTATATTSTNATTVVSPKRGNRVSGGGGGGGGGKGKSDDADDDSSADDSSYFADPNNLPSPKSNRRFSFSSNHSTQAIPHAASNNRESDASLSLSEDSEDAAMHHHHNHHHHHHSDDAGMHHHQHHNPAHTHHHHRQHSNPGAATTGLTAHILHPGGVPEIFPHQITRMHSVSSLVSTSSQNSSGSDPIIKDELSTVAVENAMFAQVPSNGAASFPSGAPPRVGLGGGAAGIPSGRMSPIMGEHPSGRGGAGGSGSVPAHSSYFFSSPSSVNPGPSPPTILPAYQHALSAGFPHPQPHHHHPAPLTSDQQQAWVNAQHQPHPQNHPQQTHGSHQQQPQQQQQQPNQHLHPANNAHHQQHPPPVPHQHQHSPMLPHHHHHLHHQHPQLLQHSAAAAAAHDPRSVDNPSGMVSSLYIRESLKSNESVWSRDTLAYSEDSEGPTLKETSGQGFGGGNHHHHTRLARGSSGGGGGSAPRNDPLKHHDVDRIRGVTLDQKATAISLQARSDRHNGYPGSDVLANTGEWENAGFKVYWQRWIMLMYMSILNLLSDWTCYSVAPISLLTQEAFGHIDPEQLVVVFLGANAVASACEPIILSRLGLRRTVLFGALLLMIGSIVKSGGMPPIIQADLQKGEGEWRLYLGFFLVGLSQPLYQCTPALLSASWFPEAERTMATGVALNANQLGIGFAFIFGTLLVADVSDIPKYFGFLSIISTATFLGALVQFADAPPTPPSDTARVMRGTLEVRLPSMRSLFKSVFRTEVDDTDRRRVMATDATRAAPPDKTSEHSSSRKSGGGGNNKSSSSTSDRGKSSGRSSSRRSHRSSQQLQQPQQQQAQQPPGSASTRGANGSSPMPSRRDSKGSRSGTGALGVGSMEPSSKTGFHGLSPAPSPLRRGPVGQAQRYDEEYDTSVYPAPSPMMSGPVAGDAAAEGGDGDDENEPGDAYAPFGGHGGAGNPYTGPSGPYSGYTMPPQPNDVGAHYYGGNRYYPDYPPPPPFYYDPRFQQHYYAYYQQQMPMQHGFYPQPGPPIQADPYYYSYQYPPPPPHTVPYESPQAVLPAAGAIDEGAEPVLTITPHHLDIDIRDDQVLLSIRACMARRGFVHALVSFTVSGVVINTLSTFMDYLVRLNGAGREYTGIVGGTFQFVIMVSSLLVGKLTDKTRAYYSVIIAMLVLGAFGLAECGVNLDEARGSDLRWSLVIVAALVGPLQPVSTELGVDVVYPLSENTVLVIQQLFSNLLSALFIPCFKAMKDFGRSTTDNPSSSGEEEKEKPEYTFSFYLLIVLHATATVFFGTFNGRYLRYEHELSKLAEQEQKNLLGSGEEEEPGGSSGMNNNGMMLFHPPMYAEERYEPVVMMYDNNNNSSINAPPPPPPPPVAAGKEDHRKLQQHQQHHRPVAGESLPLIPPIV